MFASIVSAWASDLQYPWYYYAATLFLAWLAWRVVRGKGSTDTDGSADASRVTKQLADRRRRNGRHVAILTLGSRGDVQPYVALAVALAFVLAFTPMPALAACKAPPAAFASVPGG